MEALQTSIDDIELDLKTKKQSKEMSLKELLHSFSLKKRSPNNMVKIIDKLKSKNILIKSVTVKEDEVWIFKDDAHVILNINEDSDKYPEDDNLLCAIGEGYHYKKEYKKAIDCFERAIESKKDSANAWCQMAKSYSEMNDKDNSIKCLNKIKEINPDNDNVWSSMAYIYRDLNEYDETIKIVLA